MFSKCFRVLLVCLTLMLITSILPRSQALVMGEDLDNEMDANWGSKFRDYVCDYDGNLLQTNVGIGSFKLTYNNDETADEKSHKKSGKIESIKLIETSKGPNGQSPSKSGNKFIAVEIELARPNNPSEEDFYIYYRVECKKDIKNKDKETILYKGDVGNGCWFGVGSPQFKTIAPSMSLSESLNNTVAYDSQDYDVKTVMKFSNIAQFAVNWKSNEDAKYLTFTTDKESTPVSKGMKENYRDSFKYIKFTTTPSWKSLGRLVLNNKEDKFVYQYKSGVWQEVKDCWYDKSLGGYVIETNSLGEYITSDNQITSKGEMVIIPEVVEVEPTQSEEQELIKEEKIVEIVKEMPTTKEEPVSSEEPKEEQLEKPLKESEPEIPQAVVKEEDNTKVKDLVITKIDKELEEIEKELEEPEPEPWYQKLFNNIKGLFN